MQAAAQPSVSFGFVAICLSEENCSPAGSVTVKSLEGLSDDAIRGRILRTALRNLDNTIRILHFLHGHHVHLYRMSAQLLPLATHDVTAGWAWWEEPALQERLERIGHLVKKYEIRVSSHLPDVCVLSTPKPEVLEWLLRYIRYHQRLFELMSLDATAKLVLHVGGAYGRPDTALRQAEANFLRLDPWAQERILLENDDRSFSAAQVLHLAQRVGVPVVFDYHHHVVRNDGEQLGELLPAIFATWRDRPPKVHVSSPRSAGSPRAHADYVAWEFVEPFFAALDELGNDVDVMVEAKKKDLAMFALQEEFAAWRRCRVSGDPARRRPEREPGRDSFCKKSFSTRGSG